MDKMTVIGKEVLNRRRFQKRERKVNKKETKWKREYKDKGVSV